MIVFDNVAKAYKTPHGMHTILKDLSFTIGKNEKLGILGPNGAGKSTLLNLISGAQLPSSGAIRRHGRISWPLGFAGGFNSSLSGIENCLFVSRIYGRDEREVIDYVTEFSELGEHLRLPVRGYSSGMRARLSFGLSLAFDFDFYVIDEVIAVGDAKFRAKCTAAFKELHARTGMILVSHNVEQIRQYCTRVGVVHKKNISFFDDVEEGIAFYKKLTGQPLKDESGDPDNQEPITDAYDNDFAL